MLSMTAGSTASARRTGASRVLAALVVPLALTGCMAGQQNAASFVQTAAQEEVAAEASAVSTEQTGSVAALAPVRNENGTISGSRAIDQMIAQAADANNIPRDLAFGVVHVESTYNPRARGSGVYGLSQIMPSTARSMGFSGSSEDLLEPATNLRYGMRYLAGAWEKGGRDVCRASMKYKGGHRATTMTRSAANYCSRVRQQMQRIAGNPILHGAPVALAVNAPATAAAPVQVASAQAAEAAPVRVAAAARPTSAGASAASALAQNGRSTTAAAGAAIEAATHSQAGVAEPSPRPDTSGVAAASSAAETVSAVSTAAAGAAPSEGLSLANETAAGPAGETGLSEPDPGRFGS